jgi:SLT domain-containing protein
MMGDPSRGLFQTIGATFNAYALPGHNNIYNPIDNASAAVEYIKATYGSVFNVPGIVSMEGGGGYVGYAGGVTNAPGGWSIVGERGPEAMYVPKGSSIVPNNQLSSLGDNREILARLDQIASLLQYGMTIDGQRVSGALMPYITSQIRYAVGAHGM